MFNPMSDESDIRLARSAYNARKSESTLIAWICSDAWTRPHYPTLPRLTGVSWSVKGSARYETSGIVSGEIEAYTRHIGTEGQAYTDMLDRTGSK